MLCSITSYLVHAHGKCEYWQMNKKRVRLTGVFRAFVNGFFKKNFNKTFIGSKKKNYKIKKSIIFFFYYKKFIKIFSKPRH